MNVYGAELNNEPRIFIGFKYQPLSTKSKKVEYGFGFTSLVNDKPATALLISSATENSIIHRAACVPTENDPNMTKCTTGIAAIYLIALYLSLEMFGAN